MTKYNFWNYAGPYIDSLMASGEKLTYDEWKSWIEKESNDYGADFTDEEISWILESLENHGYITDRRFDISLK